MDVKVTGVWKLSRGPRGSSGRKLKFLQTAGGGKPLDADRSSPLNVGQMFIKPVGRLQMKC